jgi:hypothetical protein
MLVYKNVYGDESRQKKRISKLRRTTVWSDRFVPIGHE